MKPGAVHELEALVPLGGNEARDVVLILHEDDAFLYESPMILVIPLTPPPDATHGHPMVKVVPTAENGLKKPMVAMIDRLHGVDRVRIGNRIGEVDRSTMIDVYRILDRLIGRAPAPRPSSRSGDTMHTQL